MTYTLKDIDDLQAFFDSQDIDKEFIFEHAHSHFGVNREYIDERLRLLRLNAKGAKNEKYGLDWYEVLLAIKQYLSDDRTKI